MTLSNFLSKLNWRLIVLHIIACWFFIDAFRTLIVIHDYQYLNDLTSRKFKNGNSDSYRFLNDMFWIHISCFLGLLTGFIISLILSLRFKWFWFNSIIVLLVTYLLWMLGYSGWNYLREVFLKPELLFKSDEAFFVTNGLMMLTIGLCLFFMKWSIRFINGNK